MTEVQRILRSAWGSHDFSQTPQLAKYLFCCLYVARLFELTLVDAIALLRPGSKLRQQLLPHIPDPEAQATLAYLDRQQERRQDELTASTIARLDSFINDPLLRSVYTHPVSISFEDAILNKKILWINLGHEDTLSEHDVRLAGRFMLNSIISIAFKTAKSGERNHPVYLIVDEASLLISKDFTRLLDLGRGLKCHAIFGHQYLRQLLAEDESGHLMHSVLADARTKVIFGGLPTEDLAILERDVMSTNPWAVKDEIWTPQFMPKESTRISRSQSQSRSRGRSVALPESETTGNSASRTRGSTTTLTEGSQESISNSMTEGETLTHSENNMHVHSRSTVQGEGSSRAHGRGTGRGVGQSRGRSEGMGASDMQGSSAGETLLLDGVSVIQNTHESMGMGLSEFSGTSYAESEFNTESESWVDAVTRSYAIGSSDAEGQSKGVSHGTSHAKTSGSTRGTNRSQSKGESQNLTEGASRSVTRGRTPSRSEGSSESVTISESPFTEHHERMILTSRTYLTPEEQTRIHIQMLKNLPPGCAFIKPPTGQGEFIQTPWVDEPTISRKRLESALARIRAALPSVEQNACDTSPEDIHPPLTANDQVPEHEAPQPPDPTLSQDIDEDDGYG